MSNTEKKAIHVEYDTEEESPEYTSVEEVGYLMEGDSVDYSVQYTGYLCEIFGVKKVVNNEKELFKAVINNGTKRSNLLIRDPKIVEVFHKDLIPVLSLDGAQGQVVQQRTFHWEMDVLNYELIIQRKTKVIFYDAVKKNEIKPEKPVSNITFVELAKAEAEIMVKAYIKTNPAAAANKSGTMNFGSGTITEGIHKVDLQISSFADADAVDFTKGICVLIRGHVSSTGSKVVVVCQHSPFIKVLHEEKALPLKVVMKANKPLLKRSADQGLEDQITEKKMDGDGVTEKSKEDSALPTMVTSL